MGSVQFQIIHCASLYFSRSISLFQRLVNINYRVLICCNSHSQSSSLFFVYFGFLCLQVSSVSNFHPDIRLQRWSLIQAHLFSCVVGREEHCKQIWQACVGQGVLVVYGPHRIFWSSWGRVLSGSTLLRIQVALQGTVQNGPCISYTSQVQVAQVQVFGYTTNARLGCTCVLFPSQVPAAQVTRALVSALSQVGCAS